MEAQHLCQGCKIFKLGSKCLGRLPCYTAASESGLITSVRISGMFDVLQVYGCRRTALQYAIGNEFGIHVVGPWYACWPRLIRNGKNIRP